VNAVGIKDLLQPVLSAIYVPPRSIEVRNDRMEQVGLGLMLRRQPVPVVTNKYLIRSRFDPHFDLCHIGEATGPV
jgi:hypothetical protein